MELVKLLARQIKIEASREGAIGNDVRYFSMAMARWQHSTMDTRSKSKSKQAVNAGGGGAAAGGEEAVNCLATKKPRREGDENLTTTAIAVTEPPEFGHTMTTRSGSTGSKQSANDDGGTAGEEEALKPPAVQNQKLRREGEGDENPTVRAITAEPMFGCNTIQLGDNSYDKKKTKIKIPILTNGNYSTADKYLCEGKSKGLTKCHIKRAFAIVERNVSGRKVRLCSVCEFELYHEVEKFHNSDDIVRGETRCPFPLVPDNRMIWITVTGGDAGILYELWKNGDFSLTYHDTGHSAEILKEQIDGMISNRIFIDLFKKRGLLTSGKAAQRTGKIMQKHSAFKAEADFMGGEEGKNIANHWCQLQTVIEEQFEEEGDAEQEDHADTFSRKDVQYRHLWNHGCHPSGETRKLMTIANRKTGRWCSFLVHHSAVVTMSSKASGNSEKHWQHRIDFSDGVFCYACETLN